MKATCLSAFSLIHSITLKGNHTYVSLTVKMGKHWKTFKMTRMYKENFDRLLIL